MARRNGNVGVGGGIAALLIFFVVFWLVYEHFANPYTPPQQILTQYFDGLWAQFVGELISVVGITLTAIIIAIVAAGIYLHSKSKRRW
jgi:Fe2+ transport system protein B